MRFTTGWLCFDRGGRELSFRILFGEKSNKSSSGSTERFELVGVDAWSIGCVDVRFSRTAERGVRGDGVGRDVEALTGVWKVWLAGDLDEGVLLAETGVDGRVGTLGCSSEQG
jgi:hypothetical protein